MLHEYREVISQLKVDNAHFAKIFERHNELDQKITDVDAGREHMNDADIDSLKKEKLRLKDEAYTIIVAYKKENNL